MDGTPVFEITHKRYVEVVKTSLGLVYGIEVEHGLRRMLVGTVTGIDDGDIRDFGSITRRPFEVMAHNNQVDIIGHHLDGILESLALGGGGVGCIAEPDDTSAKTIDGGLEAKTRARGRLKTTWPRHDLPAVAG